MSVKLLTKHHLGFLSLKVGYTASLESTHVKMSHCWKSHVRAHFLFISANSYPEDRIRYWNGYMLFYERMEESKTPMSAKKSKLVTRKLWPDGIP